MSVEKQFIKKSKEFRLKSGLSEADIDELLAEKDLSYTGLELGTKTLTLEIAEAYPQIYGLSYCDFKKAETECPKFEKLPLETQNFINRRPDGAGKTVGLKGTKNRASYIIYIIKDFPIGHSFINKGITQDLPYPLNNDAKILWNNGTLKGLVKSTGKYQNQVDENNKNTRNLIYKIVQQVSPSLLEKAKKNIDQGWLKEFEEKTKKK